MKVFNHLLAIKLASPSVNVTFKTGGDKLERFSVYLISYEEILGTSMVSVLITDLNYVNRHMLLDDHLGKYIVLPFANERSNDTIIYLDAFSEQEIKPLQSIVA